MKKILYLTNGVDLSDSSDGLVKKIKAQVAAFEKIGSMVDLAGVENTYYRINGQGFLINKKRMFLKTKDILKFTINHIVNNAGYDILYIRKFYFTYDFILFLKEIRPYFKKIVVEVPTYPYYGELKTIKGKIAFWVEMLSVIIRLKHYVDRIITFSEDEKIYGIKTIKICNGISPDEKKIFSENSKEIINFISVSSISYWHGIDRFIRSMKYTKNIHFNVVGPRNKECRILEKLVAEIGLEDRVTFWGQKSENELSNLYSIAHIGVGSLGRHRSGIVYLNSLKNREYIAKGLPVIYSEIDKQLETSKFVFKVSPDETDIDIDKIVDWYLFNEFNKLEIVEYSNRFLWESQLKLVLDELYTLRGVL